MIKSPLASVKLTTLAVVLAFPVAAQAHTTYGGSARDFGSFGGAGGSATISNQAITSNFGWADGADTDWGDAHHIRAFKLVLTDTMEVTVSASANPGATESSVGGLLPGFSIYSGLFHEPPAKADYDGSAATLQWQADNGIVAEGGLNALGDFAMGNDDGDLSFLTYIDHAADGPAVNYGAGVINGDGVLDGSVSDTFILNPGSYSIVIGGADYAAQGPGPFDSFGLDASVVVSPVPEPETYAMLLAGLGMVGFAARRRLSSADDRSNHGGAGLSLA